MNAIDQSLNRLPCHTDWRRYDSPTVLRRHGRSFLERSWKPGWPATPTPSPCPQSNFTTWWKAMAATVWQPLTINC